mmetsp:Transcript_60613/g.148707  ORF Transcript_60613/g.148707 Transcript_60613/m.148707 type:complete len:287 (+) Transcript_60613:115-975(+)|eukprot:CAMPEP_0113452682 /NCGR_PEP_ID=MMETSP0014_2-20120614/6971_1 /TAXON_ID=2857 /ORGANISM="Nitzschia sp." /LENGTH=286 /DNA_ID=CAMNT_0000344059 /DNA_START=107 /DNA_END=967 /DNA_ORIENTATION=+ /assembly_acc=CAM_ASM_000159
MVRVVPPPRPYIVLFGDSLTQMGFGEFTTASTTTSTATSSSSSEIFSPGWVSLLSTVYQRRADVLNRGYSGYNTRHALDIILPNVLGDDNTAVSGHDDPQPNPPLFCTVFLGANDSALPGERQHVPKEEYAKNIAKIVTKIKQRYYSNYESENSNKATGSTKVSIILFSPPPVDQVKWRRELGLYEHFDRSNDVARQYGLAVQEVANELGCPFLDAWALLGGNQNVETYSQHLSDGLHLSTSGNRLLFDGLMDLIRTELPHLLPSKTDDSLEQGIQINDALWSDLC